MLGAVSLVRQFWLRMPLCEIGGLYDTARSLIVGIDTVKGVRGDIFSLGYLFVHFIMIHGVLD